MYKKLGLILISCALFFVSCMPIDTGIITITNTTENDVIVIFGENYESRDISVPARSSVKEPYTAYFSVYPSPTEKYVYGIKNDTTYTIYQKEIKKKKFYVTNSTGLEQIIYNSKDSMSKEVSILIDAKNIEIELDYIIGFEFAVKETETSPAVVVEHKKEIDKDDQGKPEERSYYLIRSPGF